MKIKHFAAILMIFGIFSCGSNQVEQTKKMEDETSKIHDEIMPVTFKIRDLRDSVLKKAEVVTDSTLKDEGVTIANDIQDADGAMDEFMNKLGDAMTLENKDPGKLKILTDLKKEGELVKRKTLDAKAKAENFLKKP